MIVSVIFLVFPLCLVLAGLTDFLEMKIPNRISLILLASFLFLCPFVGLSWTAFAMHLAAGAAVFTACFLLFALNVMGGGDAKLLTAAALWFGMGMPLLDFLVGVAYMGGFLTIVILLIRTQSSTIMAMGLPLPSSIFVAKKIPYGIAIAVAGVVAYPQSPFVVWALERVS